MDIFNVILEAFFSIVIASIGVYFSHRLAVSETQKTMESFKSQLSKSVYASSKRSDMEYEIFRRLGVICGDIHLVMERFYPDKMSLHQINSAEKPTLKELAKRIHELDVELNIHRAFIPENLVSVFEELIKVADQFFVCAEKHIDCWDETKEDIKKKEDLRLIAYEQRLIFYKKWKASSAECRKHLESKELV